MEGAKLDGARGAGSGAPQPLDLSKLTAEQKLTLAAVVTKRLVRASVQERSLPSFRGSCDLHLP